MTALKRGIQNIRNILSMEQTEILETALFAMLPVLLTKVTGLLFNLIAASYYGTGVGSVEGFRDQRFNYFLLASTIPDLISNILITGSLGAIIIPTLLACKRKEGEEAFLNLYNKLFTTTLIVFFVLSIFIFIFSNEILLQANSFFHIAEFNGTEGEEVFMNIVNMMRAMLIPQIIIATSIFVSSGLNLYNRYIIPTLAPLFFNVGRIISIGFILPLLDKSPWAFVIGIYIGALMHLAIQIPLAHKVGIRFKLVFGGINDKYFREVLTVSLPRMFALASEYIGLAINNFLAFSVNGISALNFANIISLIVPQLFAFTFAYASFNKLSEHFADNDKRGAENIITKTLNQILFLAFPFIITLIVLRVPIVRLSFGLLPETQLTLEGTYQIAWVLLWFAIGHIFVCGKWYMYRVFYAARSTRIPVIVSFISLILTVVLSVIFTNLFSHNADYAINATNITLSNLFTRAEGGPAVGGIALGMTVAYTFEFFALFILFYYKEMKIDIRYFTKVVTKKFIAGGAMFAVMYFMFKTWDIISFSLPVSAGSGFTGSTTLNLFFLTTITVITSFMVYYLISLLLKVEDLVILKKYLNPLFKIGGLRIK